MKEERLMLQIARSICAAMMCVALITPASSLVLAQGPAPDTQATVKITPDQLDSLVAPVALYPDNLLAQIMVASTYPLEVIQLHQWLLKNKDIKDQNTLAEKVAKQPWDPSIQAMAALPDVVKWLAEDIQWTADLGNAFLAQEDDVMAAVQRMRQKAKAKGSLVSTDQQTVETQVVESQSVIIIQQANPKVIYVPLYNPFYVYGAPLYPYPLIYYPPYYGSAVVAAGVIGFGVGVAVSAAWRGGWGWGCGWGGRGINVNINNNFNRINNIQGGNRVNAGGDGRWKHDPNHRGGAPYGDKGTANKFGGTTRGDSVSNRQNSAQRQIGQQGGKVSSTNRAGNRAGNRSNSSGNRGSSSGRSSNNIGNRSMSGSSSNRGLGSGSYGGYGGNSARSSSSRGSYSMGGSRGGGYRGGGRRR